jgi:hypothetical protein
MQSMLFSKTKSSGQKGRIYGAINVMQVHIQNPKGLFAANYYW